MKKRILLIEGNKCKRNFPNLALMKLSAHHKRVGDIVALNRMINPDKVYISCPYDKPILNLFAHLYKSCDMEIGGYGVNNNKLPNLIEYIMPDYDLYGIDYSMGFTSRGCINKCPFCVVPKNEGMIRDNQFVSEFLHKEHNKVILLDNSFTNSPKFKGNAEYLISSGIQVNINQGVNVRTMTEEKANILKDMKLKNWTFKARMLHIAWDNVKEEELVRNGIQKLLDVGFNHNSLMCYVLVNFNSSFKDDLYRCNVLWKEYKILPFIMSYKGKHQLQRWANRRFIKYCDWENFNPKKFTKKQVSDFNPYQESLISDKREISEISPNSNPSDLNSRVFGLRPHLEPFGSHSFPLYRIKTLKGG